jgi:hypothetical protein
MMGQAKGGKGGYALDAQVRYIGNEVHFLNACEAEGIPVLNCSPYIREWMLRERDRPKA